MSELLYHQSSKESCWKVRITPGKILVPEEPPAYIYFDEDAQEKWLLEPSKRLSRHG
jgi:hypothetical protein